MAANDYKSLEDVFLGDTFGVKTPGALLWGPLWWAAGQPPFDISLAASGFLSSRSAFEIE